MAKRNEWLHPDYPPLKYNDAVGKAAVEGQIFQEYPHVVRSMEDPAVDCQKYGMLSFMLFKEPRMFASGKRVYGYVKLRGNYGSKEACFVEASKIVREVDSKFQISFAPVGYWVPITDEDAFVKEKVDVRTSDDETHLRDAAVKEKEAEERRKVKEIKERQKELEEDGDIYDHPESLKYYSMKMVTEIRLMETREAYQKNLDSIQDNLTKTQKELYKLKIANPHYVEQWIDCYNEERHKAGLPNYVPSDEQMKEHDDALAKFAEENLDLDSVKLPKVTIPAKEEEKKKEEVSQNAIDMVKKQGGCGVGLAMLAMKNSASVVDAIIYAKKALQEVMEGGGCGRLVAVGALETTGGNVEEAIRMAKE